MNKRIHISLGLCITAALLLSSSYCFHRVQEKAFRTLFSRKLNLEKELNVLSQLRLFLKTHPQGVKELVRNKWPFSCGRLKAAKFLDSFRPLFPEMHYQINPQIEEKTDGYVFKVSPVVIETLSFSDREIYPFLSKLLKSFPGVLLPRTLNLEVSPLDDTVIEGKFLFDWIYLKEENYEH